jgi:hypothetical protein
MSYKKLNTEEEDPREEEEDIERFTPIDDDDDIESSAAVTTDVEEKKPTKTTRRRRSRWWCCLCRCPCPKCFECTIIPKEYKFRLCCVKYTPTCSCEHVVLCPTYYTCGCVCCILDRWCSVGLCAAIWIIVIAVIFMVVVIWWWKTNTSNVTDTTSTFISKIHSDLTGGNQGALYVTYKNASLLNSTDDSGY